MHGLGSFLDGAMTSTLYDQDRLLFYFFSCSFLLVFSSGCMGDTYNAFGYFFFFLKGHTYMAHIYMHEEESLGEGFAFLFLGFSWELSTTWIMNGL